MSLVSCMEPPREGSSGPCLKHRVAASLWLVTEVTVRDQGREVAVAAAVAATLGIRWRGWRCVGGDGDGDGVAASDTAEMWDARCTDRVLGTKVEEGEERIPSPSAINRRREVIFCTACP